MSVNISVIVPVYNAEHLVLSCLKSIYSQTVSALEIICVNDGSKDNSLAVLKEFQMEHPDTDNRKITVIDKENGGPSSARNTGLEAARGKYIGFVDCDDYIEPEMYQSLIAIAEKNQLNVVMCNILNVYPNHQQFPSEEKVPVNKLINRSEILQMICPTLMKEDVFGGPCNRIYSRAFIEQFQIRMPDNIGYGEDAVFQMQVFDKLERTWFDSNCYYHYLHREGTQSSAKPGRLLNTLEPLYKIRCSYSKKWIINEEEVNDYFIYCALMDFIITMKAFPMKEKRQYRKAFFKNASLKKAFRASTITKKKYTKKIYYLYRIIKPFMGGHAR